MPSCQFIRVHFLTKAHEPYFILGRAAFMPEPTIPGKLPIFSPSGTPLTGGKATRKATTAFPTSRTLLVQLWQNVRSKQAC